MRDQTIEVRLRALSDQWKRQAHALEFGSESEVLTGIHATIAEGRAAAYRQAVADLEALLADARPVVPPETCCGHPVRVLPDGRHQCVLSSASWIPAGAEPSPSTKEAK